MPRYLYIFSYQTPEQMTAKGGEDFADERCEALFIEADSPDRALAWGRKVSEELVRRLFDKADTDWAAQNFAHWVEAEPEKEYPPEVLKRVCTVPDGTYPEFEGPGLRCGISTA